MSYDQLMTEAEQIRAKAVTTQVEDFLQAAGRGGALAAPEYQRLAEREFAHVPALFAPFVDLPRPAAYDGFLAHLDEVVGVLSPGTVGPDLRAQNSFVTANLSLDALPLDVTQALADWHGKAAEAFLTEFIAPFRGRLKNQFMVAMILRFALLALKEIWDRTRQDIDTIAHQTLTALDQMDDCGDNEWETSFAVASAIASVLASPLSGMELITVTALGAGLSIVGTLGPDDKPEVKIQGETPQVVISSMQDAITSLTRWVDHEQHRLVNVLTATHADVIARRDRYVAARPALVDATPATVTSDVFLGDNE